MCTYVLFAVTRAAIARLEMWMKQIFFLQFWECSWHHALRAPRSNVTADIKVNWPNTDITNALLLKYITYFFKKIWITMLVSNMNSPVLRSSLLWIGSLLQTLRGKLRVPSPRFKYSDLTVLLFQYLYIQFPATINLLKTKHRLFYLKARSVSRCKHYSPRL